MPTIKRFEELEVWKEARNLNLKLFNLFSQHPNFAFRDQLLRATLSIMNNISEGFERGTDKEFKLFLNYAKGSSGEVRNMLYIALDLKYIDQPSFDELYSTSITISSKLSKLISYLKTK
jgi:four helix bundle protein